MPQKYEVFHEATQITLCKTPDFINLQAPQSLSLSCSDQEDVDDFVEMLKVGLTADHYILFDQDLKSLWKRFTRAFTVVEAAGGVVRNEKGQILMIYRKKKWDLPKGKLDPGESKSEAAVREVKEECGLKRLKLGKKIGATYHIYTQKKQIILKPTYWYKMTVKGDPKLTPEEAEGIEKVEWKSDKAYQKAVSNTYPSLKRLLDTKRLVETK